MSEKKPKRMDPVYNDFQDKFESLDKKLDQVIRHVIETDENRGLTSWSKFFKIGTKK